MTFRIEIFDRWPKFRIEGRSARYGRITWGGGGDYETFEAPTDYKSAGWYRWQWHFALQRLLDNEPVTTLVVSAGHPNINHVEVWDIWRLDADTTVMHNCFVPPPIGEWQTDRSGTFDIDEPWASAGIYRSTNDEGQTISEWRIPHSDIEEFIRRGGPLNAKPGNKVWKPGHPRRAKN